MNKLIRNAQVIHAVLDNQPKKPVIAKKALTIQFPKRFQEINLAQLGTSTFVYGLFAMIHGSQYALMNVNAFVELGPAQIDITTIDETEYYNFHYQPGDVVIKTKDLVCRSNLIFESLAEFYFKGKIPWYVGYEDMGKLYDTAEKHSRTSAKILPSVVEYMAAYVARDRNDRTKFVREVSTDKKKINERLTWVPMSSVYWSAPGTVNKLAGAYFADGVVSALVNPSERVEKIERILRA